MPLIHSKTPQALKKNIAMEVDAGKPVKQAVAIAYESRRSPSHKDEGGEVAVDPMPSPDEGEAQDQDDSELKNVMGEELMNAIHGKDHKQIMSCLESIITNHLSKE